MTRTGDVALPVVTPHDVPAGAPIAGWRWRPVIALEFLAQNAWTWDTADPSVVWDGGPELVWDAAPTASGFTDVVCDFITLDIAPGDADELYLFPPIQATLTLDNRSGAYTPWAADGRLTLWAPGRRMSVYAWDPAGGSKWWLFNGRVSGWQVNADDTVTVTAFDGLSWLAQELAGQWTAGASGDSVAARIAAAAATVGYPDRIDVDTGNVTLAAVADGGSPLDAIQRAALSDGGLFYGDADGSLDYRNRLWRTGRTDQTEVWAISDNRCTVPVVVWDPELAADDERLATTVQLVNTTGLASSATLTGSLWAGDARYVLAHPEPDQWQTQLQGDTLAGYLLGQQSTPSMALHRAALHVQDPHQQPAVWDMAVRSRRGDRVHVLHDYLDPTGVPATLDTWAVLLGVGHQISPESWVSNLNLSRTVDYLPPQAWDETRFTWDDPDPANVWRY